MINWEILFYIATICCDPSSESSAVKTVQLRGHNLCFVQ